jgi:hypothetical protein
MSQPVNSEKKMSQPVNSEKNFASLFTDEKKSKKQKPSVNLPQCTVLSENVLKKIIEVSPLVTIDIGDTFVAKLANANLDMKPRTEEEKKMSQSELAKLRKKQNRERKDDSKSVIIPGSVGTIGKWKGIGMRPVVLSFCSPNTAKQVYEEFKGLNLFDAYFFVSSPSEKGAACRDLFSSIMIDDSADVEKSVKEKSPDTLMVRFAVYRPSKTNRSMWHDLENFDMSGVNFRVFNMNREQLEKYCRATFHTFFIEDSFWKKQAL